MNNGLPKPEKPNSFGYPEWWFSTFTEQERNHILNVFHPLRIGFLHKPLVQEEALKASLKTIQSLYELAFWFNSTKDQSIAYRMLKKAEGMITGTTDILDIHFLLNCEIEIYYRHRNDNPWVLEEAISACKRQIEIAPKAAIALKKEFGSQLPNHTGYEKLIMLERRNGNFSSATTLAQKALEQGWNGDWKKIIEKCQKKLDLIK